MEGLQEQEKLRILVCDDDPLVLEALQEQLEAGLSPFGSNVEVSACENPEAAIAIKETFRPHLLLIDLYMCDERFAGIRVFEAFQDSTPPPRRIAMTAHGSRMNKEELQRLSACGLDGLLDKQSVKALLRDSYCIWQGERIYAPHLEQLLQNPSTHPARLHGFSEREYEVLLLRAQGHKIKDIASRFKVSQSSIGTNLDRISNKLGSKRPPDLAEWCRQNGIDYFTQDTKIN